MIRGHPQTPDPLPPSLSKTALLREGGRVIPPPQETHCRICVVLNFIISMKDHERISKTRSCVVWNDLGVWYVVLARDILDLDFFLFPRLAR